MGLDNRTNADEFRSVTLCLGVQGMSGNALAVTLPV